MKLFLSVVLGISIIVESTLIPAPSTLIIFMLIMPMIEENAIIWAFITGILLDLFIPRIMGLDSLIMLTVVSIFQRYHKKIYPGHNIFMLVIQLIVTCIYTFFLYKNIDRLGILAILIIQCILFIGISNLYTEKPNKKRLAI